VRASRVAGGAGGLLVLLALLGLYLSGQVERSVVLENRALQPIVVWLFDRRDAEPGAGGRALELRPGDRVTVDVRFGRLADRSARIVAISRDGKGRHEMAMTAADADGVATLARPLSFGAAQLGVAELPPGVARGRGPIVPNLAAGRPAIADEQDPKLPPAGAVDGDGRSQWRGLSPPPAQVSWAVDLGEPRRLGRAQVDVSCVFCGLVRIRLTFLGQPLPTAGLAQPGHLQAASLVRLVERMPGAVVGTYDLAGVIVDGDTLTGELPGGVDGVRGVVVTIVDATENVGLYEVRLGAP
jgi:hypothetical protein